MGVLSSGGQFCASQPVNADVLYRCLDRQFAVHLRWNTYTKLATVMFLCQCFRYRFAVGDHVDNDFGNDRNDAVECNRSRRCKS